MSKGYIIANINVTDADAYATFAEAAKNMVEGNGGVFLARGGQTEIIEGESNERIVVAEFESFDKAKEVASSVLALAEESRAESGEGDMIVVEGV